MNLGTFKAKTAQFRRFVVALVALFLALSVVLCREAKALEDRVKATGFDRTSIITMAVTYFLWGALLFLGGTRLPPRRMRQLGLACPSCGGLLSGYLAAVAVATGCCRACGHTLLKKESETGGTSAAISKEEFLARQREMKFGNLAVVKWLDRRQARKHRLICTTCDGSLTETAGKIAAETCHCCRCGARVLLDTPVAA